MSKKYIKVADCVHGGLYRLFWSRNLADGVYNSDTQSFVGVRSKFDREFLETERHCDVSTRGSATPVELLGMCPVYYVTERLPDGTRNTPLLEWLNEKSCE
jgi:hypothetical protein